MRRWQHKKNILEVLGVGVFSKDNDKTPKQIKPGRNLLIRVQTPSIIHFYTELSLREGEVASTLGHTF